MPNIKLQVFNVGFLFVLRLLHSTICLWNRQFSQSLLREKYHHHIGKSIPENCNHDPNCWSGQTLSGLDIILLFAISEK